MSKETSIPSDPGTGVKIFSITGRTSSQRERCLGMTDEERRWRAQWLKDQVLDKEEPRFVPEWYKETTNVLRRIWKTPLLKLRQALEPKIGYYNARTVRVLVGKSIMFLGIAFYTTYYFKYWTNDFTRYRTIMYLTNRPIVYPTDPNYPNYELKKPYDYYDTVLGFTSSVLCPHLERPPPPPPPPPPPLFEDFTRHYTLFLYKSRPILYPGDPDYPNYHVKKPYEYYDCGFESSPLMQKK